MMIGKPVALIQVPNRRLFSVAAAAQYLGKAIGTIRKLAELNIIHASVELDSAERRRRFSGAVVRFAPRRRTRIQKGGDAWASIR